LNDGYISEYTTTCECLPGYRGDDCGQTCPQNIWGQGKNSTSLCLHISVKLTSPNLFSSMRTFASANIFPYIDGLDQWFLN